MRTAEAVFAIIGALSVGGSIAVAVWAAVLEILHRRRYRYRW